VASTPSESPRPLEALRQLAEEQAALRRVAVLVAQGAPATELFEAVNREVGTLLGADFSGMARFEYGTVITVAMWAADGEHPPLQPPWEIRPGDAATTVSETRGAARWTDWTDEPGPAGEYLRQLGVRSSVGSPILVRGRPWGALGIHSKRGPLPPDTEARMAQFTELVATAIANAQDRAELRDLVDEQAALRRVAELVAREASQAEIFTAIAAEIGRLLGTDEMRMMRYEKAADAVVVAAAGARDDVFPVGSRWPLEGENVASLVFGTGQPARIDDYRPARGRIAEVVRSISLRSVVGAPIVVQGGLWGAMLTGTFSDAPLPPDTEPRLSQFTELMATAIANAEARAEVERLADEQAALRRVATMVAEGASPTAVFDAVAAELERVLGADDVTLHRYEPDGHLTALADRGSSPRRAPPSTQVEHRGENVTSLVRRTRRAARMEHPRSRGTIEEPAGGEGVRASVGTPIVVEGRLWGVAVATWRGEQSPAADTEERMAQFTQLLDTAIANADSRDQLTASRARLLTAADDARRRVVRDLHDGAQQRLLHTIVTLKLAQEALKPDNDEADAFLAEALEHAQRGNTELRELAHGILPAVLAQGGLRSGVSSIVSRLDLPIEVSVTSDRFPPEIEASAYFVIAEALTNVVKHAHAARAEVTAFVKDDVLHLEIRDDGDGDADPSGHGLIGLRDRVTALNGRLTVENPVEGGTTLTAALPLVAS
jgi:signal transduction histidine kinase